MSATTDLEELVDHLCRSTRLERPEAQRLIAEVLAFFAESPEQFVARRHGELQADGLKNAAIFETVARELEERRFSAPEYSSRQLRRIVYG